MLISGYHDSSDAWTETTALDLLTPAIGPPVLPALAKSHRVCAYDRPGTIRYIDGAPLTDRSTPVAQPRTTGGIVTELHDVLAAAEVKAPYVLVGHSLGGLIARAYAQAHTDQVRGVVFVDAFSATIPRSSARSGPSIAIKPSIQLSTRCLPGPCATQPPSGSIGMPASPKCLVGNLFRPSRQRC